MVQLIHEVIVPLRPNLNYPKKGKPTLVHVHIHSNSKKLQVIEVKHGKKLNMSKYHPFVSEYINSMVKEAITTCSLRFWNPPNGVEITTFPATIPVADLSPAPQTDVKAPEIGHTAVSNT